MSRDISKKYQDLAQGSLKDIARSRGERLEDVLTEADVVVMLDESSSMGQHSADKTRHETAVEALRLLQQTFPGRVVLLSFSTLPKFHWNGLPSKPSGSTEIGLALDMASQFTGMDMKFYLISDGYPTDGDAALGVAKEKYTQDPINTIFIGDDTDLGGRDFLRHLSSLTGGKTAGKVDPKELGQTVTLMLTGRK